MDEHSRWLEAAQQLRVDSVRASDAADSGHPTSSMSAAELVAVLADGHLRYDFTRPDHPGNDHLIFSKGHASPLLYALFKLVGAIDDDELLSFRTAGSRLEGHPTPALPWVPVATGSLGQGLAIGVGLAMAARDLDRVDNHVWVLCGDSEMAEGSVWEAAEHAGEAGLANLTVIVDVNRLGQTGPTRHGWRLEAYSDRFGALGWEAIEIDGHDVEAVDHAYHLSRSASVPTAIVARTRKGKGVSSVEDVGGMHGKPMPDAASAVAELGGERDIRITVRAPDDVRPRRFPTKPAPRPAFEPGDEVPTRDAFGRALAWLGSVRGDVVALDGEVGDSTRSDLFADAHPERFFEMYIAEQLMAGAATGMQVRGWVPFAATFGAFWTRAHDFVRMAAISRADLRLVGSHAGVAIGQDGPSQMALEDLAMMRAVYASTVLYPCDANQTVDLVEAMADQSGISYLRTNRGATPVIYGPDERFTVGGSRVVRSSPDDEVLVVAAGVTVHEAMTAAATLAGGGVGVRVLDLYSVKPVDIDGVCAAAEACGGRLVTVEDHRPQGGVGEAVLGVLADAGARCSVQRLAVTSMPGSAGPTEQLRLAGIDAAAIVTAVERVLQMAGV